MGGDGVSMAKFFVDPADINTAAGSIFLRGEDVSHIRKVLRMHPGDELTLCDGRKNDYTGRIEEITAEQVKVTIVDRAENGNEPPVRVTLYQGIPKGDKMELIIQKCVELGIYSIVPVSTERAVVRIDNEKDAKNKTERWQKISREAAKQCRRGIIPEIALPIRFKQAVQQVAGQGLALMPYENEKATGLRSVLANCISREIAIFIGPEGGFSEKEVEWATQEGIRTITLGPRILRTETAGFAALTAVMYALGDIG